MVTCDSPEHNAKYGIYTMTDMQTDKIVEVQVIQHNKVNNSNAIERWGGGGQIKVFPKDSHLRMRADRLKNYTNLMFGTCPKVKLQILQRKQKRRSAVTSRLGLS